MMQINVAPYRKAIVAAGAAVAVLVSASADGVLDIAELVEIVAVVLGAYGVWRAPNQEV